MDMKKSCFYSYHDLLLESKLTLKGENVSEW